MDGVNTLMGEGQAFIERHPDLNETQAVWGGMVYGFMRAIAECPNCPGKFRVPLDKDWNQLYCHSCETVWGKK